MTVASHPSIIDAVMSQYATVHWVVKTNTEGITHEESLIQPQPAGNCLNWIVGHLMTARNGALQVLGMEPLWSDEASAPYKRHAPPLTDPAQAMPFEQILADFDRSQELLLEGLRNLPAERLTEKAPFSPSNNPDETVGSLLATFTFHDAYHAGQTGVLRRVIGKPGAIS